MEKENVSYAQENGKKAQGEKESLAVTVNIDVPVLDYCGYPDTNNLSNAEKFVTEQMESYEYRIGADVKSRRKKRIGGENNGNRD